MKKIRSQYKKKWELLLKLSIELDGVVPTNNGKQFPSIQNERNVAQDIREQAESVLKSFDSNTRMHVSNRF